MKKIHWAGWAIAAVSVGMIAIGIGDDEAAEERTARLEAKAYAEGYESARDSVEDAHADTLEALHAALEAEADTTAAHEERSDAASASAAQVAERLRPQIRAELRAEFDTLLLYHEVALAEADSANASLKRQNTLLRAEIDAERSLRIRETERADRWKAAFDAAEIEIDALRSADVTILGVKLDVECGPKLGPAVGINREGKVNTSLARLECEVGLS